MKDGYNRKINYMRLSVTDKCNFHCKYCSPYDVHKTNTTTLSFDEFFVICETAVELGIDKIRITGGEPLIRNDIVAFCERLSSLRNLKQLAITTNGSLLGKYAEPLKKAGVSKLNISIDTLDKEKFRYITCTDNLSNVIDGIQKAQSLNFDEIKLNVVLIGGFNDDEIEDFVALTEENDITVRFIELMPIGETKQWDINKFVNSDLVLNRVPKLKEISFDGVSQLYQIDGYKGKIGLIRPMSNKFCDICNKIRITCDGKIKTCLHSAEEYDIKGLSDTDLKKAMINAIANKPLAHNMSLSCFSLTERFMNEIGG